MKKRFYICFVTSAVLWVVFACLCLCMGGSLLVTLATTFFTIFYHFAMRLLVGVLVQVLFPKAVDPNGLWFREHTWERGLYKFLRVRRWIGRVPTFRPEQFDTSKHSTETLVRQTCLSEIVHEIIVLLGYASILFAFFFEDPASEIWPFLITAFFAGLYDLQFVISQRYHRPQLLRHIKRVRERKNK